MFHLCWQSAPNQIHHWNWDGLISDQISDAEMIVLPGNSCPIRAVLKPTQVSLQARANPIEGTRQNHSVTSGSRVPIDVCLNWCRINSGPSLVKQTKVWRLLTKHTRLSQIERCCIEFDVCPVCIRGVLERSSIDLVLIDIANGGCILDGPKVAFHGG